MAKLEILNVMDEESRDKLRVHSMNALQPNPSNRMLTLLLSTLHEDDKELGIEC
jgi:hypothetical protein